MSAPIFSNATTDACEAATSLSTVVTSLLPDVVQEQGRCHADLHPLPAPFLAASLDGRALRSHSMSSVMASSAGDPKGITGLTPDAGRFTPKLGQVAPEDA